MSLKPTPPPYVETQTEITTEQPSLRDALAFIATQPEDALEWVRLGPTVNDPGRWTVVVHLRTDNIDVRDEARSA